jgi:ATP-binding cassette subfamily B protein
MASRQMAKAIAAASGGQTILLLAGISLVLGLAASDAAGQRLGGADFVVLQAFALRLAMPLSGLALTLRQAAGALSDTRDTLALVGPSRARLKVRRRASAVSEALKLGLSQI